MTLRLATYLASSCVVLVAAAPPVQSNDDKQMEAWWTDLESGETEATRALLHFSVTPKQTVEFLARKMKPLKLTSGQAKALLLKLDNAEETVWKPAFEELEYFDPRLAIGLETLMERYTETPGRQRMVDVLSGHSAGSTKQDQVELRRVANVACFNFFQPSSGSWWAEDRLERINSGFGGCDKKKWTRAIRAIVLLEFIATPEAKRILEEMAAGHPDAQPTKVAKAALVSLAKR